MSLDLSAAALRRYGDIGFVVSILACASYAVLAIWELTGSRLTSKDRMFLDISWKQNDGFCVKGMDTPYWSSHDVCMYTDTVTSILSVALYFGLKKKMSSYSNDLLISAAAGTFFHGLAHGGIGHSMRARSGKVEPMSDVIDTKNSSVFNISTESQGELSKWGHDNVPILSTFLFYAFWFSLLKATMTNVSWKIMAFVAALVSYYQMFYVADEFGFIFVQTVLILAASVNHLARSKAEKETLAYATLPWFVTLPVTLVGWLEGTNCEAFVKDRLYGHVVYDAMTGVSVIVWYLTVYGMSKSKAKIE